MQQAELQDHCLHLVVLGLELSLAQGEVHLYLYLLEHLSVHLPVVEEELLSQVLMV